jgi:hypothetical protein
MKNPALRPSPIALHSFAQSSYRFGKVTVTAEHLDALKERSWSVTMWLGDPLWVGYSASTEPHDHRWFVRVAGAFN